LKRALDDAGLTKDAIDGLCTGPTLSGERASELWGLNPRWSGQRRCGARHYRSDHGDPLRVVYDGSPGVCNAQRSMDTAYGGSRVTGGGITSYFYYAPWGLTRRARCTRCFSSAISCSMAPPKSNWGHCGSVSQARLPES